ncbi:hypothetical protein N9L68_08630 [bacterium]|nr:hypothetical protein [bacterium]
MAMSMKAMNQEQPMSTPPKKFEKEVVGQVGQVGRWGGEVREVGGEPHARNRDPVLRGQNDADQDLGSLGLGGVVGD